MSNVALIAVLLRVIAIFLFLAALRDVSWSAGALLSNPRLMVLALLKVLLAIWFFFWPLSVTRKLVSPDAREKSELGWEPDVLQSVLFSAAGVWLLVTTITSSELVGAILFLAVDDASGSFISVWSVASVLFRFAFGVWLLFGARGLVRLLSYLRTAGRS